MTINSDTNDKNYTANESLGDFLNPTATNAVHAESRYSTHELVSLAYLFRSTPELVKTALTMSGIKKATESEAREIINQFRNEEVK